MCVYICLYLLYFTDKYIHTQHLLYLTPPIYPPPIYTQDMIDEAIMRPGRLEVQIEISLPDLAGRNQILDIHTSKMKKHGRITAECVNKLPEIADLAMNYTGAELEGLVRIVGV